MVNLCTRENIQMVVIRMPESSYFRDCYTPEMNQKVDRWFAGLASRPGLRVVNAVDWLPDSQFADGIHADLEGAVTYTQRLESEVLRYVGVTASSGHN